MIPSYIQFGRMQFMKYLLRIAEFHMKPSYDSSACCVLADLSSKPFAIPNNVYFWGEGQLVEIVTQQLA